MRYERAHISLGWFVVIATALHVLLSLIAVSPKEIQEELASKKAKDKEIEIVDPKMVEEREVVETSKLKDQDPELSKNKARFYSEETNRTKEETRSPLHGTFRQGKIIRGGGDKQGSELPLGEEGEQKGLAKGDGEPDLKDLMLYSRTPNDLPKDIKEGRETILNTDKVVYASFINRIAEEVYDPWVSNLESAIREYKFKDKKLETNLYITKLLVTMDKDGDIQGISIVKSSGNDEVDDAPKRAFWALEGFKNPPSQLMKEDGFIRLTYEFHLEYKNSGFSIIPGRL